MTTLKARPTVYKGIQMRSRLEARFAAELDAANFRWRYEPVCFAGDGGQYLPDFVVESDTERHRAYIEVKPTERQALDAAARMFVIHEYGNDPDSELIMVWPVGDSWRAELVCSGGGHDAI